MKKSITEAQLDKDLKTTAKALKLAKLSKDLDTAQAEAANHFKDSCSRYLKDAKHFKKEGNYITALRAVNYAHAWLDAGAMMGFFDVKGKSDLFTTD